MKGKKFNSQGMNEFNKAFEEYFKEKGIPTERNKMNKAMAEFINWYNSERKQSDTGLTPNEMQEKLMKKSSLNLEKQQRKIQGKYKMQLNQMTSEQAKS